MDMHLLMDVFMYPIPSSIVPILSIVIMYRWPGRKVMWQQWLNQFPLFICKIAWAPFACRFPKISVVGQNTTFHTFSKGRNIGILDIIELSLWNFSNIFKFMSFGDT